jgi:hypothetical protein
MDLQQLLLDELKGSVAFFQHYTNRRPGSPGFGLTVDSTKDSGVASIAATGFALTAWVIGQARGWLSREEAAALTRGTLETLEQRVPHYRGFFAHFLHMESAARVRHCEFSTIDTALCLNGVITALAYFAEPEIQHLGQRVLERVDWGHFVFEREGRALFHMAYNPDRGGDYVTGEPGFISAWDMAAEQKMMYVQAAGQLEPALVARLYRGFARDTREFADQPVIVNPGGNLFAYLYTEGWLDTRRWLDPDGFDWFNNTRLAALANREFCIAQAGAFRTYHAKSWGLSAGDSPNGYYVSGSAPSLRPPRHNGTVCVYSALAALPFVPDEAAAMALYLYEQQPQTWGPYGFYDAYNLDVSPPWYSRALYGIDKGISMINIENYLSGLVWDTYTNSPLIQAALARLGFSQRDGVRYA